MAYLVNGLGSNRRNVEQANPHDEQPVPRGLLERVSGVILNRWNRGEYVPLLTESEGAFQFGYGLYLSGRFAPAYLSGELPWEDELFGIGYRTFFEITFNGLEKTFKGPVIAYNLAQRTIDRLPATY